MSKREEFEKRFPVPNGVKWSERQQDYTYQFIEALQVTCSYSGMWEAWKAAREQSGDAVKLAGELFWQHFHEFENDSLWDELEWHDKVARWLDKYHPNPPVKVPEWPQEKDAVSLTRMCNLLNGMMDGTEEKKYGLLEPWKSTYERLADRFESPPLQAIANKICSEAPEGWVINLCMENGAAWVEAISPDGHTIDIDGADQTLIEQLNEAICIATGNVNPTKQEGN